MFKKKHLAAVALALPAIVAAPFVQVDHHAEAASKYEQLDQKKNDYELKKLLGQKLFGMALIEL